MFDIDQRGTPRRGYTRRTTVASNRAKMIGADLEHIGLVVPMQASTAELAHDHVGCCAGSGIRCDFGHLDLLCCVGANGPTAAAREYHRNQFPVQYCQNR